MPATNPDSWSQPLTAMVAVAALAVSIWTYFRTSRFGHYTELDRLYFDIVALRIEYPHLGDRDFAPVGDKAPESDDTLRYNSYALLIWNFIETIHDRCREPGLFDTWEPILIEEGNLHATWFASHLSNFKPSFQAWAKKSIPELKAHFPSKEDDSQANWWRRWGRL